MTEMPEADRAELLCRLADGELDLASPEVAARLAADPAFAAEARALLALDRELRPTGAARDLAGVADDPEPWSGADAAVTAHVQRELGPAPAPRRWPWLLLAAAAVLVAFFLWSRGDVPPIADDDQRIGTRGLWPAGTVTRTELAARGFEWGDVAGLPAMARYAVVVRGTGDRRWRSPTDLRQPHWSADAATIAALPDAFEWEVHVTAPGRAPTTWGTHVELR